MNTDTQPDPVSPSSFISEEAGANLPHPPAMNVFDKPKEVTNRAKKKDIPEGLWMLCKGCGEMITNKELDVLLKVCPNCNYHFVATAAERISWLIDAGTFQETDAGLM